MVLPIFRQAMAVVAVLSTITMVASGGLANGPPSARPVDPRKFIAKVDADHDGRISMTEWRMQGLPARNFHRLDRNHDGFINLGELRAKTPPVMDASHDGKTSAREMQFGKSPGRPQS